MMSFDLELTVRRVERSLERALGVVGRHGYEILALSAELVSARAFRMRLTVEGPRGPAFLVNQLRKLVGVEGVTLISS